MMRFTGAFLDRVRRGDRKVERDYLMPAANRSRMLAEQSSMPYDEGIRVTISLGATLARKDHTIVSLIGRADELMYRIKKVGRNRVIADL